MAWCEANRVDFVFGLARNDRLEKAIVPELITATIESIRTGKTARSFKDFTYTTLDSWSRERRVVGKAEVTGGEANPRFVVTSLKRSEAGPMPGYATPSADTNQTAHRCRRAPASAARNGGEAERCRNPDFPRRDARRRRYSVRYQNISRRATRQYEKCGLEAVPVSPHRKRVARRLVQTLSDDVLKVPRPRAFRIHPVSMPVPSWCAHDLAMPNQPPT